MNKTIQTRLLAVLGIVAIAITILLSTSGCTKDCFHSGAELIELHTVINDKHFVDTLKNEGFTRDCDLVIIGISEQSWDTVLNVQDTVIYTYKYVRFTEKL